MLIEEISKMAPPERRSKVADEFLDTPIPDSNSLTVNKKNKTIFNFHFQKKNVYIKIARILLLRYVYRSD